MPTALSESRVLRWRTCDGGVREELAARERLASTSRNLFFAFHNEDWPGEKMVWYAPKILNLFGAPELSNLTSCGAKELPALPDYLSVAMLNYISGVPSSPDPAVHH
jgi:hypothetical protein